jgi:hypothetical protein
MLKNCGIYCVVVSCLGIYHLQGSVYLLHLKSSGTLCSLKHGAQIANRAREVFINSFVMAPWVLTYL